MKYFIYVILGIFFGIIMYKSEAASWFRIYEMFQFGSFHMYGIMGSALAIGILGVYLIKKYKAKPLVGTHMQLNPKDKTFWRYIIGGILFGLGWGLAGACPGPIYVLAGAGYISILIVLLGALLGTFLYGIIRHMLPH